MPRDTLIAAGIALYGERWQTDLARALGVNDKTVRRWAAGDFEPQPHIWPRIAELCRARGKALAAMAKKIDRTAGA